MKKFFLGFLLTLILNIHHGQNISIDFAKRTIIGTGAKNDTTLVLCESKRNDSIFYPVFYRIDSTIASYTTFYHLEDFDSLTQRMIQRGTGLSTTGFILRNKAKIKLKKKFYFRVGMMPQFGWWVGKVRPGRYKLFGYRLRVYDKKGKAYEGIVYYYFNKQSFFKRFFKKRKLKKRINRLPVFSGLNGPEIIFKNDMIQEGGSISEYYYTFKLNYE